MATSAAIIAAICVGSICLSPLAAKAADNVDKVTGNFRIFASGPSGTSTNGAAPSGPQNYQDVPPASPYQTSGAGNAPPAQQRFQDVPPGSPYQPSGAGNTALTGNDTQSSSSAGRRTYEPVQFRKRVDSATPGANRPNLGSLQAVGSVDNLFLDSRGGDQGAPHVGGVNVVMGDGSVRSVGDKPLAASGEATGLPAVQSPGSLAAPNATAAGHYNANTKQITLEQSIRHITAPRITAPQSPSPAGGGAIPGAAPPPAHDFSAGAAGKARAAQAISGAGRRQN